MSASHGHATFKATGTTASTTCAKPNDTVEGSLLLAFHNTDVGDAADMGAPTGGSTWQPGIELHTEPSTFKGWWKFAGASEPANYGFTQSDGSDGAITIVRVADADPGAEPIWASVLSTGGGATINTPSVTPAGSDDLEYRCPNGSGNATGTTWFLDASDPATTPLTQVTSGSFANHRVFYRSLTSSGASGVIIARSRNAGNTSNHAQDVRFGVTVAIKSASTLVTGELAVTLPALDFAGAASAVVQAELDAGLPSITVAGAGSVVVAGELDVTLPPIDFGGSGTLTVSGGLDATLPALDFAGTGSIVLSASLGAILPPVEASGTADVVVSGGLGIVLPALTSSLDGTVSISAELGAILPAIQFEALGQVGVSGELDAVLPPITLAGSANVVVSAALSATLPAVEFAGVGQVEVISGVLDVVLPAVSGAFVGNVSVSGTLDATLGPVVASFTGISYVAGYRIGAITGPAVSLAPVPTGPGVLDLALTGPAVRWSASGPAVRYDVGGPGSITDPTITGPSSTTVPTATGPATVRDVDGPAVAREISGIGV